MSNVVHKTNMTVHLSVNTPDYSEDDYLINPAGLVTLQSGDVPSKYWKLNVGGDDVEEMTQAEKDVVDAADLPAYKEDSYEQIHDHKNNLIEQGFVYQTMVFSLGPEDRETWMGMKQGIDAGLISLPEAVGTLDNDEYIIADASDFAGFYATALGTVKVRKEAAQQARKAVFDAANQSAVDTIVSDYLVTT